MDCRMILVLESNGVNVPLVNINTKVFSEIDGMVNDVYENFKDVNSFIIYIPD